MNFLKKLFCKHQWSGAIPDHVFGKQAIRITYCLKCHEHRWWWMKSSSDWTAKVTLASDKPKGL